MRELQLYWTREAEVQPTDDTGKTMTALFGLRPDHLACFYDYAEPIPWATTEDGVPIITGRQRFRDQRFLALMPVGEAVKDYSSRPVKDGDSLKYPRAWAAYEARNAIGGAHALEAPPWHPPLPDHGTGSHQALYDGASCRVQRRHWRTRTAPRSRAQVPETPLPACRRGNGGRMKPDVMKVGEVVKVYEQDGKWYEEVCVDSLNTISRPVTSQGIAEATAAAEHAVYEVLEAPQAAPEPVPATSLYSDGTEPVPATEVAPEPETPPEATAKPKRGRPKKAK